MYTSARQTSQGTQRCYTVTHTPTITLRPNILRRGVNRNTNSNFDFDSTDDLFHEVSSFENTPYSTPQATQVMRAVSGNIWNYSEDDSYSEFETQII
jgi:hypothetical protein